MVDRNELGTYWLRLRRPTQVIGVGGGTGQAEKCEILEPESVASRVAPKDCRDGAAANPLHEELR